MLLSFPQMIFFIFSNLELEKKKTAPAHPTYIHKGSPCFKMTLTSLKRQAQKKKK